MTTLNAATSKKRPLPEGWRWVRLGEVCEVRLGKMLSPASKLGIRPVPYLRNANVQWNHFDLTMITEMDFTEEQQKTLSLRPGDLLVCEGGEPGRSAVWQGELSMCCYQKALHRLRPTKGTIDTQFVMFRMWLGSLLGEFAQSNAKTTIAHLPAIRLKNIEIAIPHLSEQRRIARTLNEQMTAVDKARAAVEARLEAATSLPAAFLRAIFDAPEAATWPKKLLGEVLNRHTEIIHPGDREGGMATFVGLEHLESQTGRRIGSVPLDLAHLTGRKPTFRRGQILYGYLRPYLNKVWITEFDGCSSVDQFAYDVRTDLADVRFVAWFMRSPTYLRRSEVVTTTGQLPRIGTEQIAAVKIGLPPLHEQRAIADDLDHSNVTSQKLSDLFRDETDAIERMPAALLRQAFKGEF